MPTTHTTPIDLRGFHGREFEGVLRISNGDIHCKGIISVNNENVYLCQNDILGTPIPDRFGYKYSWRVQDFNEQVYDGNLKSITILDQPSSIDPLWDWKDGEIVEFGNALYKMNVFGRIVIPVHTERNMANGTMTFEQAYYNGYRKLPSPPTRKLTEITEEMFRSTAWYGKKVMYNGVEQGIYSVHYDTNSFTLIQNGEQDYSQCKLIEK